MKRKIYEQTDNYKMAVEIVKKFVDEVLDGDIDAMRTFCFDNLTKFVGNIYDPDMYLIVQAIMIYLTPMMELTINTFIGWKICRDIIHMERPFSFMPELTKMPEIYGNGEPVKICLSVSIR